MKQKSRCIREDRTKYFGSSVCKACYLQGKLRHEETNFSFIIGNYSRDHLMDNITWEREDSHRPIFIQTISFFYESMGADKKTWDS